MTGLLERPSVPARAPAHVVDRQLREIKIQLPTIFVSLALCSLFLSVTFFARAPLLVIGFQAPFLLFCALRVRSWIRLDVGRMDDAAKRLRLRRTRTNAILLGLVTTVTAFAFHGVASGLEHLTILMWVGFCGIGASMALAALKPASRAILVLATAPYALFLAATGDGAVRTVALVILLAIPVAVRQYGRIADFLVELCESLEQAAQLKGRSDETLRSFMEVASDWAWERDAEGRLTYISAIRAGRRPRARRAPGNGT